MRTALLAASCLHGGWCLWTGGRRSSALTCLQRIFWGKVWPRQVSRRRGAGSCCFRGDRSPRGGAGRRRHPRRRFALLVHWECPRPSHARALPPRSGASVQLCLHGCEQTMLTRHSVVCKPAPPRPATLRTLGGAGGVWLHGLGTGYRSCLLSLKICQAAPR